MSKAYVEKYNGIFNGNVASTSTGTGTLIVTGGIGATGNLNVADNTVVSGNLYIGPSSGNLTPGSSSGAGVLIQPGVVSSTSTMSGTIVCRGGVGIRGVVNIGGYTGGNESGTESTSTSTGSLVVTGGTGVSGNIYAGGIVSVGSTTDSSSTATGSLLVAGGAGIAKKLRVGDNTASTTTATGAVVVTGGMGVSGNLNVGGVFNVGSLNSTDLTVSGNLTVNGTTTTINSVTLTVDDKNIEIGSLNDIGVSGDVTSGSPTITNINTTGIVVGMYGEAVGDLGACANGFNGQVTAVTANSITLDNTANCTEAQVYFIFGASDTTANGGGITLKGSSNKTLTWSSTGNNWTSSENFDLSSGKVYKINNVQVLSNTQLGSDITFNSNTASTTTGTGTLIVTGGTGVSGNVYAGGIVSVGSTTDSSSTATGSLLVAGGVGIAKKLYVGNGTASTTTGTGSLVVTGGTGVSGNIYAGGIVSVGSTTDSSSTATGSLLVAGGAGIAKKLYVGDGTASTATGTGAVVVTGGMGISGNLNVGGVFNVGALNSTDLTVSGNLTVNGGITTINSTTLTVDDKNIELGSVGSPTDFSATGGGIILKGDTDKTITWDQNWTSSENFDLASGKVYKINNVQVLSDTQLGNAITFSNSTVSTSTGTGTLVVTGGVGVSGVIHCRGIKTNKLNPGVALSDGATPSPRVSIKFPVNFKNVAENNMFTVPTDCMFLIDSMEIITTTITGAATAPTVRLGNTSSANAYYGPTQVTSNSVGARHIIENPQDGVAAQTTVTCGVTVASTATTHTGFIKVNGELIYLNDTGTLAPNIYLDGCAAYGPGAGAL